MGDTAPAFHTRVNTLNEHIADFEEFALLNGHDEEFHPIHFVGEPDPHTAESSILDHWDDFLQYSRGVLNNSDVPQDEAIGYVDAINLDYKRTLSTAQSLP